jgi:hypothetical protein
MGAKNGGFGRLRPSIFRSVFASRCSMLLVTVAAGGLCLHVGEVGTIVRLNKEDAPLLLVELAYNCVATLQVVFVLLFGATRFCFSSLGNFSSRQNS